ncbi:XVIPCD domain-containing protein [Lysobacter gummosus]|uniref:XVIPCD domain-containing protein n=1 Tax=Lysobacter gummosus TaxID=262324 RepID=UPI003624DA05
MSRNAQELQTEPQFQQMPAQIQKWVLESPNATADFSEFFNRGGVFERREGIRLPYYSPEEPPKIVVDQSAWDAVREPGASAWPQRYMFGTLAHEIGHDRYNTGSIAFTGRTGDEYVQYRAGLEANAIFNAFPIFKDLENLPEFNNNKPFSSIGYLNEVELGALYGDWKAGRLDDAGVAKQITAKVADAPYTLNNPPSDMNHDGVVTHRDAYLRDYARYIEPKLQSSPDSPINPADPKHPDNRLLEHLREQVRTLDQQSGKGWDDQSERLSASALVMAKGKGFTVEDGPLLAFNRPTDQLGAGEILHLFRQGPHTPPDPDANRTHMPTAEALSVPVEQRYQQTGAIGLAQTELARSAQQEFVRSPDESSGGGPKFTA